MPFHWCPEETAAVIAAGSAAAFGLVWVKARWFIFVGWLRRKLGPVDKRHCCLHVAPNRAGPPRPDERMLTKEDVMVSFDAIKKADRVFSILKTRSVPPLPGGRKVRYSGSDPDGLRAIEFLKSRNTGLTLPDIDVDEPLANPCRVCHCPKFNGQIHDERVTCQHMGRTEEKPYQPPSNAPYPLDLDPLPPETT